MLDASTDAPHHKPKNNSLEMYLNLNLADMLIRFTMDVLTSEMWWEGP